MRFNLVRLVVIVVAAICLDQTTKHSYAGLLVDHAPNTSFTGSDYPSDFVGGQQILDQFKPSVSGAVTSVTWWGTYRDNSTHTDDFTFRFYNGFIPGTTPDYSAHASNVTRTSTGQSDGLGYDIYRYTATLSSPWSVTANTTEGFSIVNNVGGFSSGWAWLSSSTSGDGFNFKYRESEGASWTGSSGHVAFQLNSSDASPVPEPSSFALLGLGGIGLALRAYFRRSSSDV